MAFVQGLVKKVFMLVAVAFGVYSMFVEIEDFKWTLSEIVHVGPTGKFDRQNPFTADLGTPSYVEGILVQAKSYHDLVTGTVWMNGKIKTKIRIEKQRFNYPIRVFNKVSTIKIVWDRDVRIYNFIVYGNDYVGQSRLFDSTCISSPFYLIGVKDNCGNLTQLANQRSASSNLMRSS